MPNLREEYLERWRVIATSRGLPPESYNLSVKLVEDSTGKSPFSFGVLHNAYRFERYALPPDSCALCEAATEAAREPSLQLAEGMLPGYICVTQKFPGMREHSLAIAKETRPNERPVYTTSRLDGLEGELASVFRFGSETGWRMYHNGVGVGASIPGHEHWHMTNFHGHFPQVGKSWGFESSERKTVNAGAYQMPGYPFAHMVFDTQDTGRIVAFLGAMHNSLASNYSQGFVPHILCQGESTVLVVPAKQFKERGLGSGDIAGNIVVKTREEFEQATHASCIQKIGEILYPAEELNLTKLL